MSTTNETPFESPMYETPEPERFQEPVVEAYTAPPLPPLPSEDEPPP